MGEFERLLQRQAENPNFLSGAITAGAAKLMSERVNATSRIMNKLNQSLQFDNQEPLNTYEQLEKLKGDTDAQEKIASIEEQAQEFQALTQNIVDRKDKFSQIYDQALSELAQVGGEDAQRMMQQLRYAKEGKLASLDEKGAMPEKLLKYKGMQLQYDWSEDKYKEWYNDNKLRKDIATASDAIIQDIEFGNIKGGNVRTWSEDKLNKFTEQQKNIINRAYENLGGKVSKGTISQAFKLAMDNTGKSFTFNEMNPLQKYQLGQLGTQTNDNLNAYKGILTAWSENYNSLDQNMKDAISIYAKEGKIPFDMVDMKGNKIDEKYIKGLYDIYKPDGEYMFYYSKLTGAYGNKFFESAPYKMETGQVINNIPKDRSLIGIIKPDGFSGFVNQSSLYSPHQYDGLLADQQKKLTGLTAQSFSRVGADGKEAVDDFSFDWLKNFSIPVPNMDAQHAMWYFQNKENKYKEDK